MCSCRRPRAHWPTRPPTRACTRHHTPSQPHCTCPPARHPPGSRGLTPAAPACRWWSARAGSAAAGPPQVPPRNQSAPGCRGGLQAKDGGMGERRPSNAGWRYSREGGARREMQAGSQRISKQAGWQAGRWAVRRRGRCQLTSVQQLQVLVIRMRHPAAGGRQTGGTAHGFPPLVSSLPAV